MENVIARVGEDSRRNGRMPVDRLLEKLEKEREELIQEKKDVEFSLTQLEDSKRQELSSILMKRLNKSRSIEATTRLESQWREKRAPLIKQKQDIEKRLHDIKSRLLRSPLRGDSLTPVMTRIEGLLERIARKIDA